MAGVQDPGPRSRRQLWLGGVGLAALSAVVTLAFVALAPVYGAPVGVGVATGPSMGAGGDLLVVYADVGDPAVGDVVVFDAGARHGYVRHRVVGETAAGYRTAGDRLPYVDQEKRGLDIPHVTDENLLGREVLAVPVRRALAGAVGLLVGMVALAVGVHGRPLRTRARSLARVGRGGPGPADLVAGRQPGFEPGDECPGGDPGHHGRGDDAGHDGRGGDAGHRGRAYDDCDDRPGR